MNTSEAKTAPGFAVWITGMPASGKSTVTKALIRELSARGVRAAVLESDALRKVLTPRPRYDEEERRIFYGAMVYIGRLLTDHGIPVIFDATANRRAYRDGGRERIDRFLEVFVDCPLSVCMARDPKGIYKQGREGAAATVPGLQAEYEAPDHPDVVIHGDRESPDVAAQSVVARLIEKGYLKEGRR